jgi:hypothetical protein
LDIIGQIDDFPCFEFSDGIKNNRIAFGVLALILTSQVRSVDVLTASSFIGGRNFILRKDSFEGTFGNTGTTVNAGFWVYIHLGPTVVRITGDDTIDGTYFDAATVSEAEAGDDMGHVILLVSNETQHGNTGF